MNKEYIYNGGNVTVIDENGNARPVDYSDNLEEILIQENLIEDMENRIKELEMNLENTKESNKPYIPVMLPTVIFALITAKTIMFPLLGLDAPVDTIFGAMNNSTLVIGVVGSLTIPFATAVDVLWYRQDKHNKRSRRADVAEHEYLKKAIETQKEKLEELKNDKTKANEIGEFKVEKINDSETLRALKSWLILYSNLGYSAEKYYKLYQKEELEESLAKEGYTEYACECAKEYIEEKGPTLIKRNKSR